MPAAPTAAADASTMPHRRRWTGHWPQGCSPAAQQADLITYRDSLNPAQIGRKIADLQNRLLILAKEKTEQLYLANIPTALPDIHKGILIKAG